MLKKHAMAAAVGVVIFSLAGPSTAGPRGPKPQPVISPESYSDYRYLNQLSSDFRDSDRFDLENPIKIRVRVHRLYIPETGYAELHFSYPEDDNLRLPADMAPDTPIASFRRATLQTPRELERLGIRFQDFPFGMEAVITGWPATPQQRVFSELLVDEIVMFSAGKHFVLHPASNRMVKFADRDKPRPDPLAPDLPPAEASR